MSMLGIVSNRFSDGNGGRSMIADHALAQPDVLFAAPDDLAALPQVLADFAARGVSVVAVDGGDGTVRDVLSALPAAFGDDWPAIAVMPSGKTNLIARDVGAFAGLAGLNRLLTLIRNDLNGVVWSERRSLEVTWRDDPQRVVHGLFFGAGIFTHATRMVGEWAHQRGIKQRSAVALTIARIFWESWRGPNAATGTIMALDHGPERPRFLVLATTLHQLMLGFWPFPPGGSGDLHWLDIQSPPRRLARALWAAWRGSLTACPALGYEGGRSRELNIELTEAFVVDGELYEPGPGGITLRAGRPIRFIAG